MSQRKAAEQEADEKHQRSHKQKRRRHRGMAMPTVIADHQDRQGIVRDEEPGPRRIDKVGATNELGDEQPHEGLNAQQNGIHGTNHRFPPSLVLGHAGKACQRNEDASQHRRCERPRGLG